MDIRNEHIESGQGYLRLIQKEVVEQWGRMSGGVTRTLELQDDGNGRTLDLGLSTRHDGPKSDAMHARLSLTVDREALDALITRLQQIRDSQDRYNQEQADWEKRQRTGQEG